MVLQVDLNNSIKQFRKGYLKYGLTVLAYSLLLLHNSVCATRSDAVPVMARCLLQLYMSFGDISALYRKIKSDIHFHPFLYMLRLFKLYYGFLICYVFFDILEFLEVINRETW